jgi:DnaJ-domain-containing protein 1
MRRLTVPPSIAYDNGALVYRTPFDPILVARLKQQVPSSGRQWDKARGVWLIAPAYGDTLVQLTEDCFGVKLILPLMPKANTPTETRVIEVRYIGATKDRGNGERTAYGWCEGGWNVIVQEAALRSWFGLDPQRTSASATLYAVLGLHTNADENDIRKAYRRLALQWHPDRCHEIGAAEQFIRIQHSYEVLNNPLQRKRYDAGLTIEATLKQPKQQSTVDDYRSPLRCGLLLCKGAPVLGRFVVSEVLLWEDIVSDTGLTLSTSWPNGSDHFVEAWV